MKIQLGFKKFNNFNNKINNKEETQQTQETHLNFLNYLTRDINLIPHLFNCVLINKMMIMFV